MKKVKRFQKSSENLIVKGDNLLVLDEFISTYREKVKCIYIDPPYNNGDNYAHYDDNKSHEMWIAEMEKVLTKLFGFLTEDGSMWISIDDKELHYLKVLADKVMGRNNFVTTIVWQQRTTRENRKVFSNNHEYILVYVKNQQKFKNARNLIELPLTVLERYKNPDNDPRGPWQSVTANVQAGHAVPTQFYDIIAPNGKLHKLPKGRCWIYNQEKMNQEIFKKNIWFGPDGNGVPRIKKFLKDAKNGVTPETLWLANEVGTNKSAKKHILSLDLSEETFDTPKPEELIKRIFDISTNDGDLVLDAFLGSGTTTAVAHKMNRNYIGIEVGNHINTIVIPRMNKVIEGEQGGISKKLKWNGGGDFTFVDMGLKKVKQA